MLRFQKIGFLSFVVLLLAACKKNATPEVPPNPKSPDTATQAFSADVTFNGLVGSEFGSTPHNIVYLDLSTATMTPVNRSHWELAFYCGDEFRVMLNNGAGTSGKVLDKTDLNAVVKSDTAGLTLGTIPVGAANHFQYFDSINRELTGSLIPEVSATAANNKVIILDLGGAGWIPERPWLKIRVLRNGSNGYTLQYAPLADTTYKSVNITKDAKYHFKLFSFDSASTLVKTQPEKNKWDLAWGYTVYKAFAFGVWTPYFFADMIELNQYSNVQALQKVYADSATASAAYAAFNKDSIKVAANAVVSGCWVIGDSWRDVKPPQPKGVLKNRFYIIKDTDGKYFKFKGKAVGQGNDGGTRGKPEFKYELIR